jgi:cold shock CspA family protein
MSDTTTPNNTTSTTTNTTSPAVTTTETSSASPVAVQLQTITVPDGPRSIARVKWFDNTLSYGFATVTSGEHAGRDIFVHQSNILTLAQGIYRTLRMGEYIEFNVEESTDSSHRYQAIAVTGPGAGQLMCESNPRRPRFQSRTQEQALTATNTTSVQQQSGETSQQTRNSRPRRNINHNGGYRQQAPIQVVVEYPNPPHRQQRRPRQPRQNTNQTSSASAAANIAATLAAGN